MGSLPIHMAVPTLGTAASSIESRRHRQPHHTQEAIFALAPLMGSPNRNVALERPQSAQPKPRSKT